MSEENVAIIHTLFGAFFRRDVEVMEALMSPEAEWDSTRMADALSELAGIHRGPEGTRAFWGGWLSSWQDLRFDYELRDGRVVKGCWYPDHESALEAAGLSE